MTLAQSFPLHLRTRPESGALPRGWLADLKRRYEEGPEGFIAIDREMPEDMSAPPVLGWGRDRSEARAAAGRRSNRHAATFLVYPCTAALREAAREELTLCLVFEDVAYTLKEPTPDTVIEDWLDQRAFAAHGEAGCDIAEWDEMMTLITSAAYAYLYADPAVAIGEDGRFGWTSAAKVRGEVGDDGIAPLCCELDRANAEIKANLR